MRSFVLQCIALAIVALDLVFTIVGSGFAVLWTLLTRIARSAILVSILPAGLMQTRPPARQSRIGAPHPTPLRAETSIAFDLRSTRCWLTLNALVAVPHRTVPVVENREVDTVGGSGGRWRWMRARQQGAQAPIYTATPARPLTLSGALRARRRETMRPRAHQAQVL